MHQEEATSLCLSCLLLLLGLWCPAGRVGAAGGPGGPGPGGPEPDPAESGAPDPAEWGSGSPLHLHLQDLLHSFPADGPFTADSEGQPANCSQRFWLPPASPVCWEHVASPQEFQKSRLLVLQNRAFLQAVSASSGVMEEEGGSGISYQQQARDEVRGAQTDNQNSTETIVTMQEVFLSLEERRREEKELRVFSSIKEKIASTNNAIDGRDQQAAILEEQLSSLEESLFLMQHRLNTLMAH